MRFRVKVDVLVHNVNIITRAWVTREAMDTILAKEGYKKSPSEAETGTGTYHIAQVLFIYTSTCSSAVNIKGAFFRNVKNVSPGHPCIASFFVQKL